MEKELWEAVRSSDTWLVTRLLKLGVDVNSTRAACGDTLLIQACRKKNKEMIDLLLTKSADVNVTGWGGETALIVAAMNGLYNIIDILLKTKDINVMKGDDVGRTAIHWAAWNNHVTILERLLSCFVPVDINDNYGRTPLWWAACYGRVHCVDVLLKHGASPQHESKSEGSPLEIAKRRGRSHVVEMMEEAIRSKTPKREELVAAVGKYKHKVTLLERQLAEKDREIASLKERLARIRDVTNVESDEVVEDDVTAARAQSIARSFAQSTEDDHRRDSYSRRVLQAIQGVGSTRWYPLGRDCGETRDQLREFTVLVNDCDKVQALFDVMAQKGGEKQAADKLLDACKTIQNPIFAEVKGAMDKM